MRLAGHDGWHDSGEEEWPQVITPQQALYGVGAPKAAAAPDLDPDRFAKAAHWTALKLRLGAEIDDAARGTDLPWNTLDDGGKAHFRALAAAVLAAQGEPCAWTRAGRAYREEHGPNPSGPPIAEVEAQGSVAVHLWALGWWQWELEHDLAKARSAYEAEKKRADGLLERALRAERAAQERLGAILDAEENKSP